LRQPNQFDLLKERRFGPFFWTQFLGAGNDNIYKNALILFAAFHGASMTSLDPNALVNLAGAALLSVRFVTRRSTLHRLERWQTSYLPVFALWAAAVVVVLPPLFGFS